VLQADTAPITHATEIHLDMLFDVMIASSLAWRCTLCAGCAFSVHQVHQRSRGSIVAR
jgi:hypothetical protein